MTRYPKSGKGRKWTIVELKAIGSAWRGDALNDGDGLVGAVRVAGTDAVSVHFRYGFRWQGRRAWHYCGTWPNSSLESIRAARDQAHTDLKIGVNPSDRRVASRIEEQRKVEATLEAEAQRLVHDATLQALFEQWVRDGVSRKDGNAEIRRSFGKDVLPALGVKPIRAITEHDLRGLLRTMVARGVNRMAVTLSRDIRHRVIGMPKSSSVCHCTSCRRASGAQSVAWFVIERIHFTLFAGELAKFQSSVAVTRGFCRKCGTSLTYEHADDVKTIELTTATLDCPELFPPTKEIWLSEKVSWVVPNPALQHHS